MKRLSKKEFWDSRYAQCNVPSPAALETSSMFGNLISGMSNAVHAVVRKHFPRWDEYASSYRDYLLWSVILPKYLSQTEGKKVLEIGSAPGTSLVQFNRLFGSVPYGVEYTPSGVELNRRVFMENGLNPDNVLHADYLSDDFQAQYRECFDTVFSIGFVEHFSDAETVIAKHLDLLKVGGHLIVCIPNSRGFGYLLGCLLNRDMLAMHNRDIMRMKRFRGLFENARLDISYCDYHGTFELGRFQNSKPSLLHVLHHKSIVHAQPVINVLCRILFGARGAESSFFSPNILFVGEKRARPS